MAGPKCLYVSAGLKKHWPKNKNEKKCVFPFNLLNTAVAQNVYVRGSFGNKKHTHTRGITSFGEQPVPLIRSPSLSCMGPNDPHIGITQHRSPPFFPGLASTVREQRYSYRFLILYALIHVATHVARWERERLENMHDLSIAHFFLGWTWICTVQIPHNT